MGIRQTCPLVLLRRPLHEVEIAASAMKSIMLCAVASFDDANALQIHLIRASATLGSAKCTIGSSCLSRWSATADD